MHRAARYVGQATASGVLGWMALILIFEGAYWAEAAWTKYRRDGHLR